MSQNGSRAQEDPSHDTPKKDKDRDEVVDGGNPKELSGDERVRRVLEKRLSLLAEDFISLTGSDPDRAAVSGPSLVRFTLRGMAMDIIVAIFPDVALEYLGPLIKDKSVPWSTRVAALESLASLARVRDTRLQKLLHEMIQEQWDDLRVEKHNLVASALLCLAEFYPDEETGALLYRAAERGSRVGLKGLQYRTGVPVEQLRRTGQFRDDVMDALEERVGILGLPDCRQRLGSILEGKMHLRRSKYETEELWWVMEVAGRRGYEELSPLIRKRARVEEALGNAEHWEKVARSHSYVTLRHAVRILIELGTATEQEKRFAAFAVINATPEQGRTAQKEWGFEYRYPLPEK